MLLYSILFFYTTFYSILGSCPPCPQTVHVSCYCGKSSPTIKRCSASAWTCNTECGRLLSCGIHTCLLSCHPGSCSPCSKSSTQFCCCKKAKEPRPCSSPPWKCGTKCGNLLKCGFHSCDNICHTKGIHFYHLNQHYWKREHVIIFQL